MRTAVLVGLAALVALAAAAETTPNPADVKASQTAQDDRDKALVAEKKARDTYLATLKASKQCQEDFKRATTYYTLTQKLLADMKAMGVTTTTILKNKPALAMALAQTKATVTGSPTTIFDKDAAAAKEKKALKDTSATPATSGDCVLLTTKAGTDKTAYDNAKKATKEKQTALEEKLKKAKIPTPKDDNPLQNAATEARSKERTAAEKLSDAYNTTQECTKALNYLKKIAQAASDQDTLIKQMLVLIKNDPTTANVATDTTNSKTPAANAAAEVITTGEAVNTKKGECDTAKEDLAAKKKAHTEAEAAAVYAEKVAANPSLATTPTTKATTAPTTKASTTAAGTTKATTKAGATTTKAGASANPASSSGKKDEGPDATQNVDGVPLSPDQPCCMKANAGMCAVNVAIRNACNTECGCEKTKGTCTGQPPKKCRKDGKSGNPDAGAAPAPTPKPCTDKAGSQCTEWATRTSPKPSGGTAKECSIDVGYYMQNQCTKACNLCNKNADVDEYFCWGWAFVGECKGAASSWMQKFCALSCANDATNGRSKTSSRLRMRRFAKIARARTLRRIRAARRAMVAKVKRRRALAGRRNRAVAARRAAGKRRLSRSRIAAMRRRKLQLARRKAANN